jgi:hypothetical protein
MMTPTTDYEPILRMLRLGRGPAEIIETLGLSIGRRQIQRIAQKHGMVRPQQRIGRLDEDHMATMFDAIVEQCMVQYRGLDPYLCSDCGRRTKTKCDIHHLKYDGATLYDLAFVCRRCNTSPINVGLV